MNLPNFVTSIRIFLSPVFIVLFLMDNAYMKLLSVGVILICEISDIVDGYLARKYKSVTTIGKLLDPLADSIFRFSVFLSLFATGYAQLWMIVIIFYRDSIVSWIRIIAASENCIVSARITGKIKAWAQGIASISIVCLVTLDYWVPVSHLDTVSYLLMALATLVTAYSAVDYFLGNLSVLKSASRKKT